MNEELPRYIEIDTLLYEQMDDQLSKVTLRVAHTGLSNKNTFFTKPSLEYMAQTIIGKPIIGNINEETGHFEGHNVKREVVNGKVKKTFNTRPYGFIPESARPRFETFETKKGPLEYLVVDGIMWNRYPEGIEAFEKNGGKTKQSMELHMNHTGYTAEGVYYFEKASVTGLCLLGPNRTTGMTESVATLFEMDEDLQQEFETLKQEYESKEGAEMPTLEEIKEAAKKQIDANLNPNKDKDPESAGTEPEATPEEGAAKEPENKEPETPEDPESDPEEEPKSPDAEPKAEPEADPESKASEPENKEPETKEPVKIEKPIDAAQTIEEFEGSELFSALPEAAQKAIKSMRDGLQGNIKYLEACIADLESDKKRVVERYSREQSELASEMETCRSEISELQTALTTYEAKELEESKVAKLEELKPVLDAEEYESLETNRAELTVQEIEAAAAQFVLDRAKKLTYEAEGEEKTSSPSNRSRSLHSTPKKRKTKEDRYPSLNKYFK